MPHPKEWALPPPEHQQTFETLSLELLKAMKRPLTEPNLYGRNGQRQFGVDFVLQLRDGLHAYQCKRVESFCFEEFEAEVEETRKFPNPLVSFTVLTTAPNDARLQDQVHRLSLDRRNKGQFPVAIVFWSTIRDWLAEHLDVGIAHFPELIPRLEDLHQGAARRIEQELPGTTVEFRPRPGQNKVIVHPGPDGVPLSTTFFGAEALEKFQAVLREGESVTFTKGEFSLGLPESITALFPEPGARAQSLTLSPSMNGRTALVDLVVRPCSKHRSPEIFLRRATQDPAPIAAQLTIHRHGTHRLEVRVVANRVALDLLFERWVDEAGEHSRLGYVRRYDGAFVEAALAAERIIRVLAEGAYVGILGNGVQMVSESGPREVRPEEERLLDLLEKLVELSDLAGWDLKLPAQLNDLDFVEAESLLELFRTGRRAVPGPTTVQLRLDNEDDIVGLKGLFASFIEPQPMELSQQPGEAVLFGQVWQLPAVQVRLSQAMLPAEVRQRLLSASAAPVLLEIEVPAGAEILQVLVDREWPAQEALPSGQGKRAVP